MAAHQMRASVVPHVDVLFSTGHHPKGENFRSPWDFIHQFQQHINRDAKGRFTARTFKRLDHLVHEYGNKEEDKPLQVE